MALNLQETELISTFDYGISSGDVISGSEYIWCINSKDNCLNIKSTREQGQTSLPYHDFGILSNENFKIITGTDFSYNKQKYLVLSIEVLGANQRNLLSVFKLSVSKVTCSFQVPYKATNLQVLVKNVHYFETSKNASFLGNFEVSCLAACAGGAVQIFDITPSQLYELNSNESQPLQVYWIDNTDDLVNEDIDRGVQIALKQSKIFGFFLNKNSLKQKFFDYVMANDKVTASLPIELVKITSLKYEKQIDSVLVGFNFGCFQIWSMKTLSIESSSGYGENSKPVVGFSLLQPQNDPQKCVYLIVAHSRSLKEAAASCKKAKMDDPDETRDESQTDEFEIDEDDDESESSFILMFQLIYDKCVNVFLSQNESYMLYEGINHCGVVFDHEFSLDTLKCVKTNYSNELSKEFSTTLSELFTNDQIDSSNSKIISVQSTSVCNNRLQLDLACIIWALVDKKSASSDNFFLSVFNLNNWYVQCMPSKMRPVDENCSSRKNAYFTNYTLSINCELDAIKFISLIDIKIRKVKNQNNLSLGNALRELLVESYDAIYDCDDTIGYDIDEETYLSMSFDLMMLTPFTLTKLSIKPIEHQIHQFISQQDDLINYPEKVYFLLTRYHLMDKIVHDDAQPKFIPIFDYLLETSQIYAILKSLWKLNNDDTMIMSNCSLKSVLEWSWSKVCIVKKELNNLNGKISTQLKNHFSRGAIDSIDRDQLSEFLNRENNILDNLIQIFKQFLKLNSTSEGHDELNKKLCIVESIKCYVEHLILFNRYELLLPPSDNSHVTDLNDSSCLFKNYLNEIQGNLKIIQNRCSKRKHEQTKHKYPFTYMIDCLVEECMPYANVSKFFLKNKKQVKFSDQSADDNLTYPPKSILELLEICLECNLSTKMKQILILYVLCDLMHTEMSDTVKKHILKVINAYCSTSFTIMSTNLDAAISVPWSSSVTSIVSLGTDPNNPNQSSCLFDLVNGLYLIDSHFVERAFKYLRGIDVNYLEFYEKYFILYNSVCLNEFKMAGQYLWLFQKLNASSIPASAGLIDSMSTSATEHSDLFKIFPKTMSVDANSQSSAFEHEQVMHARLMLTIYLANNLVNEAYELIKPHLLHLKTKNVSSCKLSKELLVHFFSECETFKHWKQMTKLASLDSDFFLVLLNYLEAKKDVDSIGKAIDLHVNNRNYKKAIQLYDKHHNLIASSNEFTYLSSMIDIAKEMQNDFSSTDAVNQYNLITSLDLKECAAFEYKFSLPLREVCKNSKRCLSLLNASNDMDYVNLLKFSEVDFVDSSMRPKVVNEITNTLSNETPTREFMASACKKRKASTPHPNHIKHMIGLETPDEKPVAKHLFMSEFKDRVLTSALKSKNITQSVSKSVKFKTTRITREFNNDNVFDREEVEKNFEENQENVPFDDAPKRLEFDEPEEKNESMCSEKSTMADSEFELKLEESTKMEDEESMAFEEKKIDIDSMISQIPILSQTDEIKKSIFEKVTSSARKSIGDLDQPVKSSITVEPIVNAAILHKCSTVKEFESPFRTENKYSLATTPFSPIRNETCKNTECEQTDVLNQEFIEAKSSQVNFELSQKNDLNDQKISFEPKASCIQSETVIAVTAQLLSKNNEMLKEQQESQVINDNYDLKNGALLNKMNEDVELMEEDISNEEVKENEIYVRQTFIHKKTFEKEQKIIDINEEAKDNEKDQVVDENMQELEEIAVLEKNLENNEKIKVKEKSSFVGQEDKDTLDSEGVKVEHVVQDEKMEDEYDKEDKVKEKSSSVRQDDEDSLDDNKVKDKDRVSIDDKGVKVIDRDYLVDNEVKDNGTSQVVLDENMLVEDDNEVVEKNLSVLQNDKDFFNDNEVKVKIDNQVVLDEKMEEVYDKEVKVNEKNMCVEQENSNFSPNNVVKVINKDYLVDNEVKDNGNSQVVLEENMEEIDDKEDNIKEKIILELDENVEENDKKEFDKEVKVESKKSSAITAQSDEIINSGNMEKINVEKNQMNETHQEESKTSKKDDQSNNNANICQSIENINKIDDFSEQMTEDSVSNKSSEDKNNIICEQLEDKITKNEEKCSNNENVNEQDKLDCSTTTKSCIGDENIASNDKYHKETMLSKDNLEKEDISEDKKLVDVNQCQSTNQTVTKSDLNKIVNKNIIDDEVPGSVNVATSNSQVTEFAEEMHNTSMNSADKTLEEKNLSNEDIDLNISSVSNSETKPMSSQESNDKLILPDEHQPGLSRSSSQTSLYSQISSVSEHIEEKRGLKRRAPVTKAPKDDVQPRATRTSTLRRKSEMPKAETETRVTRGKSRASLEPEKITTKTVARRNSKRTETKLEKVAEEESTTQSTISTANLKKHNALTEQEESKPKSSRLTRSKARSPSPSASSIVSCSSVASIESTSTITSVKTRGRKSKKIDEQMDKTIKADEEKDAEPKEENSPTTSITSVSSVNSATGTVRSTRKSTRFKKEEDNPIVEEESSPVKKYGLRKKKDDDELETKVTKSAKKTTRTRSFRETKSEEPEKPKVTRTRSLRSSASDSKNSDNAEKAKPSLSKISEAAESKIDSKLSGPRVLLRKYDSHK